MNVETEKPHEYSDDTAVRNACIADALNTGLVVFNCDQADLLTVDLDRLDHQGRISEHVEMSIRGIKSGGIYTTSRSGHRHYWVKLKENTPADVRSMMACALGGDPMREYLSLIRHKAGVSPAYAMFETPEEAARVIQWAHQMRVNVLRLAADGNGGRRSGRVGWGGNIPSAAGGLL